MKTLSLSEVRMKLSALVVRVHATDEEVVITKNGRPAAVLVSPEEFESWRETVEILSSGDRIDEMRKGLAVLSDKGGWETARHALSPECLPFASPHVPARRLAHKEV